METKSLANRYEMQELIGRGGIGEVYSALDRETNKLVAIKVLKPDVVNKDKNLVERFSREGEALRKLNHPNIVKVLHLVQDSDHQCIIMEMVKGGTLADLIKEESPLPVERVLKIALELADALSRAHHLKIIHRDIKPANILLAEDGTPRLTDFGVARVGDSKMTEDGVVVGTFAYLSPEACRGDVLDSRSDIWAFGVVLYEMLTGKMPFEDTQPAALIHNIMTKAVPPIEQIRPDTPVALIDLIYRMLEKGKDARIPRMRMVGAELEAIIDGLDTDIRSTNMKPETGASLFETPTVDDSPTATPSQPLAPHNLPAFTTPFVGRPQELQELGELLQNPEQRLITILGLGGIGKTRLAVAAAQQNLDVFVNGVYFVQLAPINDNTDLVTTIAENIGFSFSGSGDSKEELISYLREKKMLLILDNFEHLIACADLFGEFLKSAPYITLLVTSRERLRLQGEYTFELDPMVIPATTENFDTMLSYPVVQLFLESARRVAGDFELDEESAPYVAHICQLVHGIPLGIELAAGWLEMLPIEEIVMEIERSLDFLETDLRDVPARHRSMRAVFEYSWNLMNDDERETFMKLSVFRGGFEREAALKVTGASLRNLMTLVNKSLLRRAPDGRYIPQKVLREYAEEMFAEQSAELEATRRSHADYFANFMKKHEEGFYTKIELKTVQSVEREHENVKAAWEWALVNQEWSYIGDMLQGTMLIHQSKSLLAEAAQRFGHLADTMEKQDATHHPLYWRARIRQALSTQRLGEYEESFTLAEESNRYFTENPDPFEQSYALNCLSYSAMMQGRYQESMDYASEATKLAYVVEDMNLIFNSLGNLGYAKYLYGDNEGARTIYEELNQMAEQAKYSPIGRAFGLNNLGEIVHRMGHFERARELYEEAYQIFKSYGTRRGMAFTLNNLAGVYVFMGENEKAQSMYERAYKLNKQIGDRDGIGHSVSALGNQAFFTNDYSTAEKYYREALEVRQSIGNKRRIADSLTDLANVAYMTHQLDDMKAYIEQSLAIRHEIGDVQEIALTLLVASLGDSAIGNLDEASTKINEALKIAREHEFFFAEARAYYGLGSVALARGDAEEAEKQLKKALQMSADYNIRGVNDATIGVLSELLYVQGHHEKAIAYAEYVTQRPVWGFDCGQRHARRVLSQARDTVSVTVMDNAKSIANSLSFEEIVAEVLGNK